MKLVDFRDVHKIISFSGVFACLPRRSRRRQGLSFLDRINGIYWIIFFFSPFPEEKEKENPPAAEGIIFLAGLSGLSGLSGFFGLSGLFGSFGLSGPSEIRSAVTIVNFTG
jgi:hypothetical protein